MTKRLRLFLIGFSVFFGGIMLLPAVSILFEMYYFGIDPIVNQFTESTLVRAILGTVSVTFITLLGVISVGNTIYIVVTAREWD